MKKIGFFFLVTLVAGLYLFIEKSALVLNPAEEIQQTQVLLVKPVWEIHSKTSNVFYEVTSNKAKKDKSKEIFLLDFPVFKSISGKQIKSSISSDRAIMELGSERLIMKNKVHLILTQKDDEINLFAMEVNCDLKNKNFASKEKIRLETFFFNLESKGFELKESQEEEKILTFPEAHFVQNNKKESEAYGKADLIIFRTSSDVLTMVGSAEIKLSSLTLIAEEIEYNYKTKTIVSSKKSRLFTS